MTAEDLAAILEAIRPMPYILIGGMGPVSQQERANEAWKALGARMGFDGMTVQPVSGQPDTVFTAEEVAPALLSLPVQLLDDEPEDKAVAALRAIQKIVQEYLPPGGGTAHDAMSKIIACVDPWPLDTPPVAHVTEQAEAA